MDCELWRSVLNLTVADFVVAIMEFIGLNIHVSFNWS